MFLLQYALAILVGYLLGSIPTGYILGRMKGVDVREVGSGRTGGSNVMRSVGRLPAILTGLVDVAKGTVAVFVGRVVLGTEAAAALAGIAAVVGHNWSIFIGFRGGAGTGTSMGGYLLLAPIPAAVVGLVSAIIGLGTRYSSVGSILISCLMPLALLIAVLFFGEPVEHLVYALGAGGVVLFSHRPNIRRLLKGTERRIGEPAREIGAEERA